MKSDILINEINLITNEKIRKWTIETLENSPDYFFKAQASSTGKYHPACTIKVGGLVVHVKRAVYLANHMCEGWGLFGADRDIVIAATILHDIAKVPNPKENSAFTFADYEGHPLNAKKYYAKVDVLDDAAMDYNFMIIDSCIKYHMGLWTPKSIRKDIDQYSLHELIVYTADYLSSRKDLIPPKDL